MSFKEGPDGYSENSFQSEVKKVEVGSFVSSGTTVIRRERGYSIASGMSSDTNT